MHLFGWKNRTEPVITRDGSVPIFATFYIRLLHGTTPHSLITYCHPNFPSPVAKIQIICIHHVIPHRYEPNLHPKTLSKHLNRRSKFKHHKTPPIESLSSDNQEGKQKRNSDLTLYRHFCVCNQSNYTCTFLASRSFGVRKT